MFLDAHIYQFYRLAFLQQLFYIELLPLGAGGFVESYFLSFGLSNLLTVNWLFDLEIT